MERLHEQILLLLILVGDNIDKTRICFVASYSTVAHLVLGLTFKGFLFSSGLQDIYIHHDFDIKLIFSYSCCSDMWFSYNYKNFKIHGESIKENI
jgi:hypothetical protein